MSYKVQWLSESFTWHTEASFGSEQSALQKAERLADSGRYSAVRVKDSNGAVIYSA